jgi:hypothetical protein
MIARLTKAVLIVIALIPTVQNATEGNINYISMFVRHDEERSCGLHRLNSAERARLNDVFKTIVERQQDNLRNSALAYLTNQNWSEVQILGTEEAVFDSTLGPRKYVKATRPGTRYLLEPESYSALMPGSYLGKTDSAHCTVLDTRGDAIEFLVRHAERIE